MNTPIIIIIFATLAIVSSASAQSVHIDYDASGNQIVRRAELAVQKDNEAVMGKKLKSQKDCLVSAYPNPASTHITICIANECIGWHLTIYDQADHAVYQCKVLNTELSIDVSSYVPATYAIRVASGDKLDTFKFVKL